MGTSEKSLVPEEIGGLSTGGGGSEGSADSTAAGSPDPRQPFWPWHQAYLKICKCHLKICGVKPNECVCVHVMILNITVLSCFFV